MSSSGSYGGSNIHALYGVWIDQALQSKDPAQMTAVLQEVRKQYPGGPGEFIPLYGVFINRCIEAGASREELQSLLEAAKAAHNSDLAGAISKLEAHLGKS